MLSEQQLKSFERLIKRERLTEEDYNKIFEFYQKVMVFGSYDQRAIFENVNKNIMEKI